jgi:zinc transport system ATP-binding protein
MAGEGSGRALIEAVAVSVRFGAAPVLDGVDVAVNDGEIVTLIGPNGSGKTTLVRVMLGLLTPDRGVVRRRAGIRIGYVPQHMNVDAALPISVRRFLRLGGAARFARMDEALSEVDGAHLIDHPVSVLSGGELKRVLMARALLRAPDLLVLDEPSAGIDIPGQAELYALIRDIRDRRACGILLVSHDLHLVMAATDEVVCLNHHVCCHGRPEAVRRDPEYLALFGTEAAALAVYTHRHDHRHDVSGEPVPAAVDAADAPPGGELPGKDRPNG